MYPKNFQILRPGFKIHWNPLAGLQNPLKSFGRTSKSIKMLGPKAREIARGQPGHAGAPENCKNAKESENVILGVTRSSRIRSLGWNDPSSTHQTKKVTFLFSSFLVRLAFLSRTCFGSGGASFFRASPQETIKKINTLRSSKSREIKKY